MIDEVISLLIWDKDVCLVLPTLPHALALWPHYRAALKGHFTFTNDTKTAIVIPAIHAVLRLWVPFTKERAYRLMPTQPMDGRYYRRGFTSVSPYYTKRELRRVI